MTFSEGNVHITIHDWDGRPTLFIYTNREATPFNDLPGERAVISLELAREIQRFLNKRDIDLVREQQIAKYKPQTM